MHCIDTLHFAGSNSSDYIHSSIYSFFEFIINQLYIYLNIKQYPRFENCNAKEFCQKLIPCQLSILKSKNTQVERIWPTAVSLYDILNTMDMSQWFVSPNHLFLKYFTLSLISRILGYHEVFKQSNFVWDNKVWL